jgi:hypothetical protein
MAMRASGAPAFRFAIWFPQAERYGREVTGY